MNATITDTKMNLTMQCLKSLVQSQTHHLKLSLRIKTYSSIEYKNLYFYKGLYSQRGLQKHISALETEISEELRETVTIDIVDFSYICHNASTLDVKEDELTKVHCFFTDALYPAYMYFYSQLQTLEEIYNYLHDCWGGIEIIELETLPNHYNNDGEF